MYFLPYREQVNNEIIRLHLIHHAQNNLMITVLSLTEDVRHVNKTIETASVNSAEFHGIRPRMYIEDLL